MKSQIEGDNIVLYLQGKLYGENYEAVGNEIMEVLDGSDLLPLFDMSDLEYISSAGIRILMKVLKREKKKISIRECSDDIYSILETTGLTELFDISRKMRNISVDGCEIIGKGFYGTVYRIDEDTIVKVYDSPDSLDMIKNEKEMAKLAFINGIPTAISFDIVKVGKSFGSVFELLNAKSFNDIIIEDESRVDEIVNKYVDFLKVIHETKIDDPRLCSAKKRFIKFMNRMENVLGTNRIEKLDELVGSIPESNCIVHGDIQMKNVMLMDSEPMLIDMDTLAVGNLIFDFAPLYVTYNLFEEDEPGNSQRFLGISHEMEKHIWDSVIRKYFDTDDEKLKEIENKIRLVALVLFLRFCEVPGQPKDELGERRLKHTLEHIDELIPCVENLII